MSTRRAQRIGAAVGFGLIGAALVTELRKPARKRTWHGRILGVVPYDFRRPTVRRVKSRWWNPDDPRILMPRAIGVGWDINLGRLLSR